MENILSLIGRDQALFSLDISSHEERIQEVIQTSTFLVIGAAGSIGEAVTKENTWVKRPGTGEIKARDFQNVLGRRTNRAISADQHISWSDLT